MSDFEEEEEYEASEEEIMVAAQRAFKALGIQYTLMPDGMVYKSDLDVEELMEDEAFVEAFNWQMDLIEMGHLVAELVEEGTFVAELQEDGQIGYRLADEDS